jgi:hypothetical protein
MLGMNQTTLKQILDYTPQTGVFTWRINRPPRGKAGAPAGYDNGSGYIKISVNGIAYYSHRLAFLWMLGEHPDIVDHINGVRNDNRWANLRSVTQIQNGGNTLHGVGVRFRYGRWYARYTKVHLGVFDSRAEAEACYQAAKIAHAELDPTSTRAAPGIAQKPTRRAQPQRLYMGRTLSSWARELGIPQPTLHHRIHVQGMSFENAIKGRTTRSGGATR